MPATQWTHAMIMEQLPAIIADCLGIDESEVLPHAHFKDDLGGESIDEIDLAFRCDRAFGCQSVFRPLLELKSSPLDAEGFFDTDHLQAFLGQCPGLSAMLATTDNNRVRPEDLRGLFTTEAIAWIVLGAIEREPPSVSAA